MNAFELPIVAKKTVEASDSTNFKEHLLGVSANPGRLLNAGLFEWVLIRFSAFCSASVGYVFVKIIQEKLRVCAR